MHQKKSSDSFLFALGAVVDVRAAGYMTGINSEKRELTYKGVGNDFESESRKRRVVGSLAFFLFAFFVDAYDVGYVQRRGKIIDDSVEKVLNALVAVRRTAENGSNLHIYRSFTQSPLHLFDREFFAL